MKNKLLILFLIALPLCSFTPGSASWQEIRPTRGNYSVLMPGVPTEQNKPVNSAAYGTLTLALSMLQPEKGTDPNVLYASSFTDYPAGTIHSDSTEILTEFFNSSRDGGLAAIQGKLLTESVIELNGYPGREQRVDFKNGLAIIKYRHYLVKNRLYTLQVITLKTNNFNTSINKFLDSFRLIAAE